MFYNIMNDMSLIKIEKILPLRLEELQPRKIVKVCYVCERESNYKDKSYGKNIFAIFRL